MSTPIDPPAVGEPEAPTETELLLTRHERARRGAPPVLFVAGLAMLLFGGLLTFDHFGPTSDTSGVITEVNLATAHGRVSYYVAGVDTDGGTFRTDTSEEVYQRAAVGDEVTVARALVTGRVVQIDGPGWTSDPSEMAILFLVVAVLGAALMVWGHLLVQRRRRDEPDAASVWYRARWAVPVVVVAVVVWVVWERSNASGDAPAATPSSTVSSTSAGPRTCADLAEGAKEVVAAALERGFVDGAATRSAQLDLAVEFSSCDRTEVDDAVCTALADALAGDPGLVVRTEGTCPDLP